VKAIGEELVLGNVDKVVVVIRDKDQVALERFIFSVQNMIAVESYNKDTSVQEAMSSAALGQYFRAFLVKLNMVESQLGQMHLGDDASFAIVLELKDDQNPSVSHNKFRILHLGYLQTANIRPLVLPPMPNCTCSELWTQASSIFL